MLQLQLTTLAMEWSSSTIKTRVPGFMGRLDPILYRADLGSIAS